MNFFLFQETGKANKKTEKQAPRLKPPYNDLDFKKMVSLRNAQWELKFDES